MCATAWHKDTSSKHSRTQGTKGGTVWGGGTHCGCQEHLQSHQNGLRSEPEQRRLGQSQRWERNWSFRRNPAFLGTRSERTLLPWTNHSCTGVHPLSRHTSRQVSEDICDQDCQVLRWPERTTSGRSVGHTRCPWERLEQTRHAWRYRWIRTFL